MKRKAKKVPEIKGGGKKVKTKTKKTLKNHQKNKNKGKKEER